MTRFCSSCGSSLSLQLPPGEDRERHCCNNCGDIHFINPRIVVASIIDAGGKVLLCQRSIPPRKGYWTLPGGFMECGETMEQAAEREVLEETGAGIDIDSIYMLCEQPDVSEVYLIYRGRPRSLELMLGPECIDAGWFDASEIPWNSLAFPLIAEVLRNYFHDRCSSGALPVRSSRRHPGRGLITSPDNITTVTSLSQGIRRVHFTHVGEPPDGYF